MAIYAQANSSQGVGGLFSITTAVVAHHSVAKLATVHLFHGRSASGDGLFGGDLQVNGNLSVTGTLSKGGGSFKIDDPLDPANKTLSHSFVESPDMMNIYNGPHHRRRARRSLVTARIFRRAQPRLPLSADDRPVRPSPPSPRKDRGRFKIAGKAGAKVSWQVTGIRQDAWANAHRIPNEEDKPQEQRGTYLHPDLFGAAGDKNTNAMLRR